MSSEWIELDGSEGEGGGQVLRTSLSLSLITGKCFRMKKIRAGRPKPGLQAQHLTSVQAVARISGAQVRGAVLGSRELEFQPGNVISGKYHFAIGTAGATGLVLQTVYLPLAFAGPSEVTIEGGTHVKASPCFHFLDSTWRAYLDLLGIPIRLGMRRPGFYPRGGGVLEANVASVREIKGLRLNSLGPVTSISGYSAVAGLPPSIATRQARRAEERLREAGWEAEIPEESWDGGPGTVLALSLHSNPVSTLVFALGERGKPAERVADEAVDAALAWLNIDPPAVDEHSADQLLLPLALASEASEFRVAAVSSHFTTNASVIRKFVNRSIGWEWEDGGSAVVRIC